MSFSSFYSVVNAIKDKSAEAMTTLSSDLQDFRSIVQEDVAELSKNVRQNMQDGRLSVDRSSDDEEAKQDQDRDQEKDQDKQDRKPKGPTLTATEEQDEDDMADPLTSLKNSLFAFDVSSSLNSVGSSVQGSLTSVQGSLTSVGSKLTSLNVGTSLGSLEAMGSKLLNSADEFLGTLAGDSAYEDEELSESELSARRFRLLALQEDSETYVDPPLDVETFEKWKLTTPAEQLAEIQKEVLENYPTVGAKFTELVPSVVEADVFWAHYIYKASLLAAQEQRGADLLEHALNDDEEEIGWDVDSPKAKDDDGKPIFPDDESKEEEDKVPVSAAAAVNGPTSSSDGESWIELDERKESTSSGASSSLKEPTSALAELKLEEGDEAAEEDSLDWGDDDDLSVPETATAATADAKAPEATPATHEDAGKRGEDWGEWD
ncbi:BSD domain-containing protein 1 [Phytophthora pseudosyringae]|uniref:BSD domain-containing protein 1 n=1 Tax=Phytophthora pseudosyringae TaxID=221518 RepID=A0A8T1VP32_9STRA|nr:BSD domain-containing protein 1 [Phytophthora pseudosyringae]